MNPDMAVPLLVEKIKPLLANQEMSVQANALAELFAMYLVERDSSAKGTDAFIRAWLAIVRDIMSMYKKAYEETT